MLKYEKGQELNRLKKDESDGERKEGKKKNWT